LIADADGNLYGATSNGGASGYGSVFKIEGSGYVVPEPLTAAAALVLAGRVLARRSRGSL
jgi:uncharacterized repeat protein (TIGR03803 family)